jgi:hypothetical protein
MRLAFAGTGQIRAEQDAVLTLAQASAESGYRVDSLRHKLADGTLPNAGRKGSPRIRRADLPRKATAPVVALGGYDPDADALELHTRRRAG